MYFCAKYFIMQKTIDDLYSYIDFHIKKEKNNYVFVDEIQEIENFELALRQLLVKEYDIYCTRSNARMLSGNLATHLSGRYIEFQITSLSYIVFLQFHKLQNNNQNLLKYKAYTYFRFFNSIVLMKYLGNKNYIELKFYNFETSN